MDNQMSRNDLDILNNLLVKLLFAAPCKGFGCLGHMNCEFGENGCYGESCAIEDVLNALYTVEVKS